MAAYLERRFSRSALWSRRIGYFALVLLVVDALAHRYGFIDTLAALGVLAVVFALALIALALAAVGFTRLWRRGDKAGRNATAGTVMALLALAPFVAAGVAYFLYPQVTDVSTDLAAPPRLALAEADRQPPTNPIRPPSPDEIDKQKKAYPEMTGRLFEAPAEQVAPAVLAEAADRGWTVRSAPEFTEGAGAVTMEFTAYTLVFAFPADVAVRVTDEAGATIVDMRSVSRYGRHDFGDNARRIADFLTALDARLRAEPIKDLQAEP